MSRRKVSIRMQIDMSGHNFIFPPECACCGGAPQARFTVFASRTTGKRVKHTTSQSWDFPYCQRCVEHVRAARGANVTASVIAVFSILATVLAFASDLGTPVPGVVVFLGGMGGTIFTRNKLMNAARRMMMQPCVSLHRAVDYLGWHGTCHKFDVLSQKYALTFMLSNQKKLVNVRQDVWQWLQANGAGGPPTAPQAARKYMT